jgi:hypothetical protein
LTSTDKCGDDTVQLSNSSTFFGVPARPGAKDHARGHSDVPTSIREVSAARAREREGNDGRPNHPVRRAAGTEVREAVENARPQESPRPRHDRREEPER